jgi:hypothetical protein
MYILGLVYTKVVKANEVVKANGGEDAKDRTWLFEVSVGVVKKVIKQF